MRGKTIFASLAVAGAVSLGLLVDCREPTEITMVIKTDVPCEAWRNATITVGRVGEVESKSPVTSTTDCSGGGDIGTLVVVPSGASDDEITIKVVAGEQRDPETCRAPGYGPGCIVARRTVRFIKYAPLRLIVPLRHACNGVVCAVDETCVVGSCKSALISNSGQCSAAGCDESTLSPGDAGVAPPPVVDAGALVDSGVPKDTGSIPP